MVSILTKLGIKFLQIMVKDTNLYQKYKNICNNHALYNFISFMNYIINVTDSNHKAERIWI